MQFIQFSMNRVLVTPTVYSLQGSLSSGPLKVSRGSRSTLERFRPADSTRSGVPCQAAR
jgi:hypothetical protein